MGKIYCITNIKNNKQYVGQTKKCVAQRFAQHIDNAYRAVKKRNTEFYDDIVFAGEDVFNVFQYDIIEECDDSILNQREIYWIMEKKPFYNYIHKDKILNDLYGEKICSLYLNGSTVSEIRKMLKCRHKEIVKVLNINGIDVVKSRPEFIKRKKIYYFDLYGNLIKEYNYISECANDIGCTRGNVRHCAIKNTEKGYLFYTCCDKYVSYNSEQPYIYEIINKNTNEKFLAKTRSAVELIIEEKIGKKLPFSQIKRKGRNSIYGFEIIEMELKNEIVS